MNNLLNTVSIPVRFNNKMLMDDYNEEFETVKKQPKIQVKQKIESKQNEKEVKISSKLFDNTLSKSKFNHANSRSLNSSPIKRTFSSSSVKNQSLHSPTSSPLKRTLSSENMMNLFSVTDAPVKKQKVISLSPVATKAMEVATSLEHKIQTENGEINFKINPNLLGKGSYCNVHEIALGQPQLFPSHTNDKIVFKCFQSNIIVKIDCSVKSYFTNIANQYRELKKHNFPVAEILNIDTFENDRFFIIEKIPHPYQATFQYNSRIDDLDKKTKSYLQQVKDGFAFAFDNGICLDYKKDNVGIRYEGAVNPYGDVVLFDYMEKKTKLNYMINLAVQSFAKDDQGMINREIYNYLMPAGVESKYCSSELRSIECETQS